MEDGLTEFLRLHDGGGLAVEDEAVDVVDGAARDVDAAVGGKRLHLIRRDFGDEVEFARAKARDAGGELGHLDEAHLGGGCRLAPVAVEARELKTVAGLEGGDPVGTRAHGRLEPLLPAARSLPAVLGDDLGGARGEAALDHRVGRLHGDANGEVVDLDHFFEVAEEFPGDGAARRLFAREALGPEREDDVIGRERRAVVEPDAGAQLELDRVG